MMNTHDRKCTQFIWLCFIMARSESEQLGPLQPELHFRLLEATCVHGSITVIISCQGAGNAHRW